MILPLLLLGCATKNSTHQPPTSHNTTNTEQNIPCSLTCTNSNYVRPGTKKTQERKLQQISKKNGKLLAKAMALLDEKNLSYSPEKSILLLSSTDHKNLNGRERSFFHSIKGYAYIAKGDNLKAIEEFHLMLNESTHAPLSDEIVALKTLGHLYLNINNSKSLKYILTWAEKTDDIKSNDYLFISKSYELNGDIKNAIPNYARAIELKKFEPTERDYQKLIDLYKQNNDPINSTLVLSAISELERIKKIREKKHPHALIKVTPEYPRDALAKGIEAKCKVTFKITHEGTTAGAHIKPGDCKSPAGNIVDAYFADSAIDAIRKFKFIPKIENEKPVAVSNAHWTLTYEIY